MSTRMSTTSSTMEYLTAAFTLARNTSTSVVDAGTPAEWLRVYDAYHASDWDIAPDRWTAEQIDDALRGMTPQWNADGQPIASKARTPVTVLTAVTDPTNEATDDDADPSNVFVRAGFIRGLAERVAREDRVFVLRAARSLLLFANALRTAS